MSVNLVGQRIPGQYVHQKLAHVFGGEPVELDICQMTETQSARFTLTKKGRNYFYEMSLRQIQDFRERGPEWILDFVLTRLADHIYHEEAKEFPVTYSFDDSDEKVDMTHRGVAALDPLEYEFEKDRRRWQATYDRQRARAQAESEERVRKKAAELRAKKLLKKGLRFLRLENVKNEAEPQEDVN